MLYFLEWLVHAIVECTVLFYPPYLQVTCRFLSAQARNDFLEGSGKEFSMRGVCVLVCGACIVPSYVCMAATGIPVVPTISVQPVESREELLQFLDTQVQPFLVVPVMLLFRSTLVS